MCSYAACDQTDVVFYEVPSDYNAPQYIQTDLSDVPDSWIQLAFFPIGWKETAMVESDFFASLGIASPYADAFLNRNQRPQMTQEEREEFKAKQN